MNEIVLFEIDERSLAHQLCAALGATRLSWVELGLSSCLVGVVLNGDPHDLARLLREVGSWIAEAAIAQVPFELDGRSYMLHAQALVADTDA